MSAFKISFILSAAILCGAFTFGWILCNLHKNPVVENTIETPVRQVHNYVDYTGYYDTVVFTEEDTILSIY